MWFKNLLIYRIANAEITPLQLGEALAKHELRDCTQMEMQSRGWVKPQDSKDSFVHVCGQHVLIALGIERKLLPAAVINQHAKNRIETMEQHQGYKPGKKQIRDIKEAILIELMPRAFAQRHITYAWIDLTEGMLVIDTANLKRAEELIELLLATVGGLRLIPMTTLSSPSAVMTRWLSGDEPPAVFTIDRDCELQGMDDEKATVRYTHHVLDAEETVRHIKTGKKVTRLAMTWANKISFVLHENLQIRRIVPLDIIKESTDMSDSLEDLFDSDFAIMSGEISQFLPDLIHALGGENLSR
ncbi:recombination associated protein RdgC [Nitrosomonas aestuarii]|uniref:Recombination-associated protein RdgC n=1 Tax=Nitrosomonas aestuarii TaxID=52441 RepID=A0A1I4A6E8_9PROT|nr:recombination-associated protein RdgC [Nitrosomonas aestuarii]SFK51905.1 recombination associated protein RdgC [Nitrosomonas aestuarii]